MNTGPAFGMWLQLFGALAVEASLIFLVAFGLQQWARTGVWRRTIWQVALAGMGLVTVLELTGLSRAAIGWTAPKPKSQQPLPLQETRKNLPILSEPAIDFAPVGETVAPVQDATASPASDRLDRVRFGWLPGILWLAGFGLVLGQAGLARLIFSICRRRRQMAVDAAPFGHVQSLAKLLGLRRDVRVTCFKQITGPIAFGIFRPTIGLPEQFCRFRPEQREAMIVHELAHLAARDPLWYLLADLVTALCWWHPLVWWSRRQFQLASETAADEASLLVPNGPDALAECLVEFGKLLAPRKEFGWLGIQGDGFRSGLGRRVERLLQLTGQSWRPANRFGGWLARAVGPAILAVTAISGAALAWPHHDAEAKTVAQSWKQSVAGVAFDALGTAIEAPAAEPAKLQIIARDAVPDLLRDAKSFLDTDKLDHAEALLDEILREEPANQVAIGYWNLVQEKREAKSNEIATINRLTNWPLSQFQAILPTNHNQVGANPSDPKSQGTDRGSDRALSKTSQADTTPAHLSESRQKMYSKLDQIVFKQIAFDAVPLSEVVKTLSAEARKLDPEKRGVNFLTNASASPAVPSDDVGATIVTIKRPLTDITLHQALDAVIKCADRSIKYSIEDYAVVFSAKARENGMLHTRWYRVDPEAFVKGLQGVTGTKFENTGGVGREGVVHLGGGFPGQRVPADQHRPSYVGVSVTGAFGGLGRDGQFDQQQRQPDGRGAPGQAGHQRGAGIPNLTSPTDTDEANAVVRAYFLAAGINLDPPKSIFFNERLGQLMVRATLEDLERVEKAVQVLNMSPPQVTIEVKTCELSEDDLSSLGLNRHLAAISTTNSSIFMSSGILTESQFRTVVKALEQRQGVNLLSAPKITTVSARQAQIKVVDVKYIVTDLDLSQTSSGGGTGFGGQNGLTTGGGVIGQPIIEPMELGPVLDVVPYVSPDGYTLQMTIIPTLKEFVGYDLGTAKLFQAQDFAVGSPLTTTTPLPIFRLRQVVTRAVVWDGQTLMLMGELTSDKVPVLGDVPVMGHLFRNNSTPAKKKKFLIFITPTVVDPAGNRLRTDEGIPFATDKIPPQPTERIKSNAAPAR